MLARRGSLNLRNGDVIDLPRLVPAFTSKGFPLFKKKYSEATRALEHANPFLTDSFLLSAYDIHHGHLIRPDRFYKNTELLFVDSGGYELAAGYDSTEPNQGESRHKPFHSDDYRRVLRKLPKHLPIVITNPDWESVGNPVHDQVLAAQKFFNEFPGFTRNFLVKPTKKKRYLPIEEILPQKSS
jgi:hypothetical protein